MNLRQRISRSILLVLCVMLAILVMTVFAYSDIEGFVTKILPTHIAAARSYDSLADYWNRLAEAANIIYNNPVEHLQGELIAKQSENLFKQLDKLKNLICEEPQKQHLKQITTEAERFIKQLNDFKLLAEHRDRALCKNSECSAKAAEGLQSEVEALLNSFKSMLADLNSTLKRPDFKASLTSTASLMNKISRIERDLTAAESEIALYLTFKRGKGSKTDIKQSKNYASRVEDRLRAVLFLLNKSIKESSAAIHKRVLSQVSIKVKGFLESFQRLKNTIESPDADVIELEDQIAQSYAALIKLWQNGTELAGKEADVFWRLIFEVSDLLQTHARQNYYVILIFLVFVLLAGLYFMCSAPKKIAAPLQQLNNMVSGFKFGCGCITAQKTGTEEIDSLFEAFKHMTERLNQQAEINQSFLEAIHSMTQINRELYETKKRYDSPDDRVESAINLTLEQLICRCPEVDLAKVMIIRKDKNGVKYFHRLGDPEISDRFKHSEEFEPYCTSVGFNADNPEKSKEEYVPIDSGITGWCFENDPGIKTAADGCSFFQHLYSPPVVAQIPTLDKREHERGLKGSIVAERINTQLAGESECDACGVLFVYFLKQDTKLSWQEIFFIQIIASQIASIIETDRFLLEHDFKTQMDDQLNMSREIQANLLPRSVAVIEGLSVSYVSKAAKAVGGDYFDFFVLDETRLGVIIADVAGKNVSAAIIMTMLKTALATMNLAKLSSNETLSYANKIIAKNITPDRFITAMYLIINSETGEVEMSSAGHNPAIIVSGRGQGLSLSEKVIKAIPLGIIEEMAYNSVCFKLKKNDLIFLYTDGVTEARNINDEEFGESGLKRFLARPRTKEPAKDLLEEVERFADKTEQHDDITAISIEFNGRA